MNHHSFFFDLAIVLVVAAITAIVARAVKQPSVLGYLFAGLVVGPYLSSSIPILGADHHRVETMAEFGVVLVMFAVGLEFRMKKLKAVLPVSGLTALLQIGFLFWCGITLGRSLGWRTVESIFLGASICISSTMLVSKVFAEKPVSADVRSNVLGILVIQDIVAIVLIAAMTAVAAGGGLAPRELLWTLGELALVLFGIVVVGVFVVPRLIRRIARTKSHELLVVVSVALCFGIAQLAESLGYSVALGAFVAGMLVAESGRSEQVEHLIAPLRDVFAAIFFVSIGMTVDPLMAWQHLPLALLVFSVVALGQFVSVSLAGILSGNGLRRSMTAGLALGQIGEFAFILAAIGISAGVVRRELQPVLVTVAVLTAFTTPLSLGIAPQVVKLAERVLPTSLTRLIGLYEDWVARFRGGAGPGPERPKLVRALRTLVLDGVVFSGVLLVTAFGHVTARAWISANMGVTPLVARFVLIGVVLLTLSPLVYGVVRNTLGLARLLTDALLPVGEVEPLVARVSRHSLRVMLLLAVTLGIGMPTLAVLGPVVGTLPGAVLLSMLVLGTGLYLYRSAHALDHEFESGAVTLAALLARQVSDQRDSKEMELSAPSLLPGLDHARSLMLEPGSHAVGKTLGQVNLRAHTGATVIAIRHHDEAVTLPTGQEPLKPGDRLALVGTTGALKRAEVLLTAGPEALSVEDAAAATGEGE